MNTLKQSLKDWRALAIITMGILVAGLFVYVYVSGEHGRHMSHHSDMHHNR